MRHLSWTPRAESNFRGCPWGLALILLAMLASSGCSRGRYRLQADQEVSHLLLEKANDPRWQLDRYGIEIDPRSRMFDPANPDQPPMPPDDPVSHSYMHYVDGKKGYAYWHRNGDIDYHDNPSWRSSLPVDADGVLSLDGATAVRTALLHSPNYQQQLETLFLSALDVSSERFRFDTQYFGGYGVDYAAAGRAAPGSGGSSSSFFDLSTRSVEARRFFTTGADLTVGLANSLVWQFSGPDTHSASTLLDFTLLQPLLRRAGRNRVMETLTLSERTLLGNVRQMERYRQGFYMDIMTGSGAQSGPTRRGGFFGAAGLGGFSGVGGGGFGGVGGSAFGGGGGGPPGAGGGAGAGTAGGFLGLLQSQQIIRNQEANIAALQSSLAQLEAFRAAGRIDFFQVEQVRQQVFQSTSQLLTLKRSYQDGLDAFKRDLGLPPQIPVRIDDMMLDQFKLIDTAIVPVQNRITALQRSVGEQIIALLPDNGMYVWTPQVQAGLEQLSRDLERLAEERRHVLQQNLPRVEGDIQEFERALPERRLNAERLIEVARREREQVTLPGEERLIADVDESLFDVTDLDTLPAQLRQQASDIRERFADQTTRSDQLQADLTALLQRGPTLGEEALLMELRDKVFAPLPALFSEFSGDVLELSLVQARSRAESATLPAVELDSVQAVEIARVARLDWMNARAALVDAWRLIEFNADNLESVLDVVFSGDIRNTGDNPIRLRDSTGSLRVGLQFDAPITRLQERNTYRQSLIDYQQARRSYYRFEDTIATQLRGILRQIELNKVNFELRRTALRVAVAQVESARLRLEEPPRQTQLDATGGALGPTTAQNLLSALNSLRGAQDDFLSVWVSYYVQRGLLDLSLGTMQLDAEGLWIDPGAIGPEFNYPNLDQLLGEGGEGPWVESLDDLEPIPAGESEKSSSAAEPGPLPGVEQGEGTSRRRAGSSPD